MPLERQAGVCLRHTLPVVYHLDRSLAGISHQHMYLVRFGVDGILHQLFDNRSRALYDLPGSNLIGHRVGQQMNDIAHTNLLCCYSVSYINPRSRAYHKHANKPRSTKRTATGQGRVPACLRRLKCVACSRNLPRMSSGTTGFPASKPSSCRASRTICSLLSFRSST